MNKEWLRENESANNKELNLNNNKSTMQVSIPSR